MTPSEHTLPPQPRGPIHLVVPRRPGADLDLLRAKLEGVPALQAHDVVWHVPDRRADIDRQNARDILPGLGPPAFEREAAQRLQLTLVGGETQETEE